MGQGAERGHVERKLARDEQMERSAQRPRLDERTIAPKCVLHMRGSQVAYAGGEL